MTTQMDDALMYAMSPTCAPELLEGLATSPSAAVRAAVAANPSTEFDTVRSLSVDVDAQVRAGCVVRLLAEGADVTSLVVDAEPAVRAAVAAAVAEPGVIAALATDADAGVRAAAAANPAAAVETVTMLAADGDFIVASAAAEKVGDRLVRVIVDTTEPGWIAPELHDDPVDVTAALAGDVDERLQLATWRHCPASGLAQLSGSVEEFVRATVASHPGCDDTVLDTLAGDAEPAVRAAVVCRRPDRVAAALADESGRSDPSLLVLRTAVEACDDPSVLATLARHGDASVRAAVAANSSTEPTTLAELAGDGAVSVATAAARNAAYPTDAASAASLPEVAAVIVAARDDLDENTAVALAGHASAAVRRQVAVAQTRHHARLDVMAMSEIVDAGVSAWRARLWELAGIDADSDDADRLGDVAEALAGSFSGTLAELSVVVAACR